MASSISKAEVHKGCKDHLLQKIDDLKKELEAVKESAIAETKSSMGDKYETGREMMMQEGNRLGQHLDLFISQLATLESIDLDKRFCEVNHGCLVFTDKSIFFISSAIGQVSIDGKQVFAISGEAPIAKSMKGKKEGEPFSFNGITQIIKKIE
ncbi:MAG: hypothetical protein RLN88_04065 [Ekhidna sp.]|uniref:hypothetical protein n=1 Tax=Ekhidna sp. TaxID=2608089 RepID=UPI0032EB58CC